MEREGHIHHYEAEEPPTISNLFGGLPAALTRLGLRRLLPSDFAGVFAQQGHLPPRLADLDVSFVDWPWRCFPTHHEETFFACINSLERKPRCRVRACAGLQVRDDNVLFTVCEG